MSNENGGVPGSGDGMGDSTRVGNAEREKAVELLGEHWRAGRLDPTEHELRVTKARAAVTRGDLDALFADLPPISHAQESARTVRAGETRPAGGDGAAGAGPGLLESKRDTIMALTPFVALLLFFITQSWFSSSWLWFLLVPVMGILLYGPGGKKNPRQKGPGGR